MAFGKEPNPKNETELKQMLEGQKKGKFNYSFEPTGADSAASLQNTNRAGTDGIEAGGFGDEATLATVDLQVQSLEQLAASNPSLGLDTNVISNVREALNAARSAGGDQAILKAKMENLRGLLIYLDAEQQKVSHQQAVALQQNLVGGAVEAAVALGTLDGNEPSSPSRSNGLAAAGSVLGTAGIIGVAHDLIPREEAASVAGAASVIVASRNLDPVGRALSGYTGEGKDSLREGLEHVASALKEMKAYEDANKALEGLKKALKEVLPQQRLQMTDHNQSWDNGVTQNNRPQGPDLAVTQR